MTQAELDDAYDHNKYAPNMPQILARFASNSDAVRARLGVPKRFIYGPGAAEGLDLYCAKVANTPVVFYIHGGAWRSGIAKNHAYAAELFTNAGVHFAVLDFINVIEAGGNLLVMAEQLRRALAWIYANSSAFGADGNRIYLCGHSSGAHLGGVLLTTDWRRLDLPPDVIKGALLSSGLYDLKPVRLSARSDYVRFTDQIEQELSPQRHLQHLTCPISVAYGSLETPEFQRQARDFSATVKALGKPVRLVCAENYNHFEIAETLANPYGPLGRAALEMISG